MYVSTVDETFCVRLRYGRHEIGKILECSNSTVYFLNFVSCVRGLFRLLLVTENERHLFVIIS